MHFKITELARRFNPKTVLRQDTLFSIILKTVKEKSKKFVLSSSLSIPDLSPWGPLDFLSTCLGNDPLILCTGEVTAPEAAGPWPLLMAVGPSASGQATDSAGWGSGAVSQARHTAGQMVTASLFITEVGEQGSGVLLLLPDQLRKCLFPFRKSGVYFLCLEPYIRDSLIGRKQPKQGASEQAPVWLHSDR